MGETISSKADNCFIYTLNRGSNTLAFFHVDTVDMMIVVVVVDSNYPNNNIEYIVTRDSARRMWNEMLADGYVAVLDSNGKPLSKRGWHRRYAKEFPTPEEMPYKKTWDSGFPNWLKHSLKDYEHHYTQQKRIYDYESRIEEEDNGTSYALKA